ncbi:MAG: hypothetical protein IKE41_00400, partial [Clostridia bacterium]|nr:hypothetical protein [Clostridia bacterium]MBR2734613.1 hypothetical protein [Clostridia bacterium]
NANSRPIDHIQTFTLADIMDVKICEVSDPNIRRYVAKSDMIFCIVGNNTCIQNIANNVTSITDDRPEKTVAFFSVGNEEATQQVQKNFQHYTGHKFDCSLRNHKVTSIR